MRLNLIINERASLMFLKSLGMATFFLTMPPVIYAGNLPKEAYVTESKQQKNVISGLVTDENGEPVIGANVIEKGTTNGTVTDVDGKYALSLKNPESILQISYIGYNTLEEKINNRTTINIQLKISAVNLGEVVAIGYGSQTKKEITGSITNISSEKFVQGVTQNAADLLQGKVAGLSITSSSGDVSSTPVMRLRGTNTIQSDNGPFIVIDGVPGGDLQTVSPQDIESISVLKDASAAAIYGSRSAGGVILITTKQGSGTSTRVTYDGYVAFSTIANKPELLDREAWWNYAKETGQEEIAKGFDKGADTDWLDEVTRTGVSHNHSLSLSGGGSKHNYRASANYQSLKGILNENQSERFNFRFQFSQRAINDRLKLNITAAANLKKWNPGNGGNIGLAMNLLPVYPVYNEDGSYWDTKEWGEGNPIRNQKENYDKQIENKFYGNVEAGFDFFDGFSGNIRLYKALHMFDQAEYKSIESEQGRNDLGFAKRKSSTFERDLLEVTFNYDKILKEVHKINVLAGYSWEQNTYQDAFAQNRKFATDLIGANNLGAGEDLRTSDVGSSKNMNRMISFFARANYNYDERYMATVTVRQDGSSKFGANHKWGLFPSGSVAWGISEEEFMEDINWIDALKLRAGYGITGNQDGLGAYTTMELYAKSGLYYDNGKLLSAYEISQNANPDLKWEQTASFNVGLDFELLKGRIGGTMEWYSKKTTDMLYSYAVPTPPFLKNSMMANVGDMTNKGFEFSIEAIPVKNKRFSWTTSINAGFNKNEVVRLSNDMYTMKRFFVGDVSARGMGATTSSVVEEGYPIGQFYGWKCDGISEDGKYRIVDLTGDGEITEADRTYIGSAQPKMVFGWSNTLTWNNFDLSLFFRGTVGNKVLNGSKLAFANTQMLLGNNILKEGLTSGVKEAPKYSDYYIEDGSHIRLDNIVLGYNFKTSRINWLKHARVYASAQNVFVLTGYSGFDPETDMGGLAPGRESSSYYFRPRTFTIGASLEF